MTPPTCSKARSLPLGGLPQWPSWSPQSRSPLVWLGHLDALVSRVLRFFFNVRRADNVIFLDMEGELLEGLEQARGWALRDARSLIDGAALEGDLASYSIEIADEAGSHLATVPVVRRGSLLR